MKHIHTIYSFHRKPQSNVRYRDYIFFQAQTQLIFINDGISSFLRTINTTTDCFKPRNFAT